MDGMELLRRLRQKTDLPVIFLTSKDEEIDELFGLKMGADDFIQQAVLAAPPGRARQGGAAPRSAARRHAAAQQTDAEPRPRARRADAWTRSATPAPGTAEAVTLTVTEFLILQALAQPSRAW